MKKEVRIHPLHTEFKRLQDAGVPVRQYFGEHQYIFSSDDDTRQVSLVELHGVYGGSWEIFCLKGGLFDDVRRYHTYQEAEDAVRAFLEPPKKEKKQKKGLTHKPKEHEP